jgi:REP element-mobilizing transposase RayT
MQFLKKQFGNSKFFLNFFSYITENTVNVDYEQQYFNAYETGKYIIWIKLRASNVLKGILHVCPYHYVLLVKNLKQKLLPGDSYRFTS